MLHTHTHRQTYKHIYTLTDIRIYTHGQRKTDVHVYTHTGREIYKCTHSDTHTQAERHKLPDTDRQTAFVCSLLPRFPSVRLAHSSLLVFAFLIAVLFIPSPRASPHMLFMSQIKRSTFLSLLFSCTSLASRRSSLNEDVIIIAISHTVGEISLRV